MISMRLQSVLVALGMLAAGHAAVVPLEAQGDLLRAKVEPVSQMTKDQIASFRPYTQVSPLLPIHEI